MCGIIGIVSQHPITNRAVLALGRDALRHRGPDDAGEWWAVDGRVGLAHRRLAIIDLSVGGHQPMRHAVDDLVIVFNGEIYNFKDLRSDLEDQGHVFRTSTDTEVILAAYREWGTDCLSYLNGMFAFALYDGGRRRLFMARDRAGEKPLFYALHDGTLRFSSEIKGLFADSAMPRRINAEALDCYLTFGYVPGERCIVEGIKKLPPGHAMLFDLDDGRSKLWRYWKLPHWPLGEEQTNEEETLLGQLDALLEDAVRRQLIADVPVGVLLSGGVDSSLVTAMVVRANPHVRTFTVRFPGDQEYDETDHARLIARHFGTEHMELDAGEASIDLLPRLARQFDEPIVDSSMIPTFLVSQLVRQHCTVVLGGDGGDELFGGYPHYDRLLWMRERLGHIPRSLRKGVARIAERLLPVGVKGRNYLQGLGVDLERNMPFFGSHFDLMTRERLRAAQFSWPLVAEQIRERRIPVSSDLLQRATRMDFENYLPEDILVKVDRASMLCSLEVRAPLLDYRVIEFAFGKVPTRFKTTAKSRKILLKKLCGRLLPSSFDRHRKQGFTIPLGRWLREGSWHDYFKEVLLGSADSPFDKRFVSSLLEGQKNGRTNSERLFALALFELWRNEYRVALS